MKRHLLFLVTITAAVFQLQAQCNFNIPSSAIIVKNIITHSADNASIWLCKDVDMTVTGQNNTIYAEGHNIIIINGDANNIYAKYPGQTALNSNNNSLIKELWTQVSDNGSNNSKTDCTPLMYDYTNAPSGGCPITTGLSTYEPSIKWDFYPNPVSDLLQITVQSSDNVTFLIYNSTGTLVLQGQFSHSLILNVNSLISGVYNLRIESSNKSSNQRFIKK
ncbi:MAG: T9SS type A sorting domain-containing protein [Vicingaceae bacterium]